MTDSSVTITEEAPGPEKGSKSEQSGWSLTVPGDLRNQYPHAISRVFALRIAGVRVCKGEPSWSIRKAAPFILVSAVPLATSLIMEWISPSQTPLVQSYLGWHLYFILLDFISVLLPWFACQIFYRLMNDLEELLTVEGRKAYHMWAERYTHWCPQVIFMITAGCGGVLALYLAVRVPGVDGKLYVTPTSYSATFWASFLVANSIYWISLGTVLSHAVTRRGRMILMWAAPARTPGLEGLARCYRHGFYMAAIGAAAYLTPLLYLAYPSPSSLEFDILKSALLLLSVTSTLAIAVLPQWWLSEVVSSTRAESLRSLRAKLPSKINEVGDWSDREFAGLDKFNQASWR